MSKFNPNNLTEALAMAKIVNEARIDHLFAFTLPVNDKNEQAHDLLTDVFINEVGGYTVTPGWGGWVGPAGNEEEEEVMTYTVATTPEVLAHLVSDHILVLFPEQEELMVSHLGKAMFIPNIKSFVKKWKDETEANLSGLNQNEGLSDVEASMVGRSGYPFGKEPKEPDQDIGEPLSGPRVEVKH